MKCASITCALSTKTEILKSKAQKLNCYLFVVDINKSHYFAMELRFLQNECSVQSCISYILGEGGVVGQFA